MKILGSFNTKLDENELYEAIQKNGQWNAIMMKKHRIFLIRPMILMVFAAIAFCLMIWFTYMQFYDEYNLMFRILMIAYFSVTCARCVHSFVMIIYEIKNQIKLKDWYTDSVTKSDFKEWLYEKFLKHTIISMGMQVILMIANSIASFVLGNNSFTDIALNIAWILVNLWFLYLLYKVLDRIVDYEMDFNIFTTDQFILYRQHWFFKTESMNIAASTIKIVKESKTSFLWSLFYYGKVSIHPEWNMWWNSKPIELFYVPKPKVLTKKLNEFIEKSKELINVNVAS